MKNFKTPLAIIGTKEQFRALIPELEKLGYNIPNIDSSMSDLDKVMKTNWCNMVDQVGFDHMYDNPDRVKVSASNPKLVLALAAMIDSNEPHEGEVWTFRDSADRKRYGTLFFRVHKIDRRDIGTFLFSGDFKGHDYNRSVNACRKATVEELMDHFTEKLEQTVSEKKIIGYELIKTWPGGPRKSFINKMKVYPDDAGQYVTKRGDGPLFIVSELDVTEFPEFWRPIYEEEKKVVKIMVTENGVKRPMEVEIKDGLAWAKNNSFRKTQLQSIIRDEEIGHDADIKVKPLTFAFGCNGQYIVHRDEIQKVIDKM